MNKNKTIYIFFITIIASLFIINDAFSGASGGISIPETDTGDYQLVGFFDLRDRESFTQITNTNTDPTGRTIHIQIFNVGNLCNENNFFDFYTPNDTHTYNLRDITTNDGNPSGVVLPPDAYGIIVATHLNDDIDRTLIGNLRIEDNNGYEYRTNLNAIGFQSEAADDNVFTFNYNNENGISLSDVVGITLDNTDDTNPPAEVFAADIVNIWTSLDIDIYDLNEVPFSCRNVIFACTDQNNPLLEALLEDSGDASVASFEYGINEAIPSSKDAPLLCPNNVISNGFVRMSFIGNGDDADDQFVVFIGLNNGNGRGSLDSLWYFNGELPNPRG